MKWLHRTVFLLGTVLLAVLLWRLGPAALLDQLHLLGGYWIPLILLEGLAEAMHAFGWRHCLSRGHQGLPWLRIAMIRQAGMAFNYLTPTAHMGGEVIKGTLLGRGGRGTEAATGILIGKLALASSQIIFVVWGSSIALGILKPPRHILIGWLFGTVVFAIGIGAFFVLQKKGKLGALFRALDTTRMGGRISSTLASVLTRVDHLLSAFHKERPWDLLKAMAWHTGGFLCGLIQAWIFLQVIGIEHPWSNGIVIFFLGAWFDLVGFLVPAGIGIQEGSRVLIFHTMGLATISGLAYGITIRVQKAFWALIGLICYFVLIRVSGKSGENAFGMA